MIAAFGALALAITLAQAPASTPASGATATPLQAAETFERSCAAGGSLGLCMDALKYYHDVYEAAYARKDLSEMCQDSLYAGVVEARLSQIRLKGAYEDSVDLFETVHKVCPEPYRHSAGKILHILGISDS